jgi:hypothetical protein
MYLILQPLNADKKERAKIPEFIYRACNIKLYKNYGKELNFMYYTPNAKTENGVFRKHKNLTSFYSRVKCFEKKKFSYKRAVNN